MDEKVMVLNKNVLTGRLSRIIGKDIESIILCEEVDLHYMTDEELQNINPGTYLYDVETHGAWEVKLINVGDADYLAIGWMGGSYQTKFYWLEDEEWTDIKDIAADIISLMNNGMSEFNTVYELINR